MTGPSIAGNVDIKVGGNVEGSIVVGNNNFVVNNNHGTIVQQAALPTQRRLYSPKPPRKPVGFVGRKVELQKVEKMIADCSPVIIHGVDGIGKTSLLKQASNSEIGKSQPDGVLFQEGLDDEGRLLDFEDLVQRLFVMLFESQPPIKADIASARTYLSNTQPLVLLNSVSLSQSELDTLLDLFPGAPILIATEKLDRPDNYENMPLGPLSTEDALELLAGSPVENQGTYAQIADLLEEVPGALIIVKKLINDGRLTAEESYTLLQTYHPLEKDKIKAALERAYALVFPTLTKDERAMLIQTAAAHGISVDRKWLEDECGGTAVSEKLETLALLQANSPRFRLMPGFRSFLLRERDVTQERERLLNHLLAELKSRWNDFEFIKDELGNLLGLLSWSAEQGQWTNVAAIGRAIDPYLTLRGLWGAWRRTLNEIQRAASSMQNPDLQGWAFHQLGTYEIGSGNLDTAREFLNQAISIRASIGDQVGLAFSQHNLQFITPLIPPTSNNPPANPPFSPPHLFGNLGVWVLGGLTTIAVSTLIFMNLNKPSTPAPVVIAPSGISIVISPSSTLTPTSTLTETPSPSPTATATVTPTSTGTPTETPTPSPLRGVKLLDSTVCFHGPGKPYLYKYALRPEHLIDVFGRAETVYGPWLLVDYSGTSAFKEGPCWMDAKYLGATAEQIAGVPTEAVDKILPHDDISLGLPIPTPVVSDPIRSGGRVVMTWNFHQMIEGELQDLRSARYLIEAWVCRDGRIQFEPSGWPSPYASASEYVEGQTVTALIKDEAGCSEPSHGRLYLVWKHGYVGPINFLRWPPAN
jgi:hypothetical protein